MSQFAIGDVVRMRSHDDKNRAANKVGMITQITEWGAHLSWSGGSGNMRLLFSEMIPTINTGNICSKCGGSNLVRAGTCILCRDCGDTSGGCG